MPNIIFYLNNGETIKVPQEEFESIDLGELLQDPKVQHIDMGLRGFQKHMLTAWKPEEAETPKEEIPNVEA